MMDIDEVMKSVLAELGEVSEKDKEDAIRSVANTEALVEGLIRAANTLINERQVEPYELGNALLRAGALVAKGPEDLTQFDTNMLVQLLSQMITFRMLMAYEAKQLEEKMETAKAMLEAAKNDQHLH